MNYLDIGILVILIMGVISGARKGFLISILNVLGLIVSIVLSFTLTKTFAGLIYKYSNIPNYISDMVSQRMTSLDSFTQIIIN
ncbi:MAG: CvpA family protein, partial [Clostridium sp.]